MDVDGRPESPQNWLNHKALEMEVSTAQLEDAQPLGGTVLVLLREGAEVMRYELIAGFVVIGPPNVGRFWWNRGALRA